VNTPHKISDILPSTRQKLLQERPAVADKPARRLRNLHGLRKSNGVVRCIAGLPIDSLPMVSY